MELKLLILEQVENVDLNAARMEQLGFKNFSPPFKNTCANHGGSGLAAVQQWDAKNKSWNALLADKPTLKQRLIEQGMSESSSIEEISWDGIEEKVEVQIPQANGPSLDLSTIMVPINTRSGCYNSRGRVIRRAHYPQTEFHEKLFRRGSSFKWDQMLSYL